MRIVFMGSPLFALPTLEMLHTRYDVVGVVTQPDQPAGRGRVLKASAVKDWSLQAQLPVLQPLHLRDPQVIDHIRAWSPNLIVVAAFGQILPAELLHFPEYGSLNVHASLLPRWRGAAPVQAAILHGDVETGVSIMQMDEGLDTGPVLTLERTPIEPGETGGRLSHRLAVLGAHVLERVLPGYIDGSLMPSRQDDSCATYAPLLRKSDGLLQFSSSADQLSRQVRAFEPWPSSYFKWNQFRLVVRQARVLPEMPGVMGQVIDVKGTPAVICERGTLLLEHVQPGGKRVMTGEEFARGAREFEGSVLLGNE